MEIRSALDAHAVAVVDLSQFHLFYPAYQGSTSAGGTTSADRTVRAMSSRASTVDLDDSGEQRHVRRARNTFALRDPTAPSRTPQVLFIPSKGRPIRNKVEGEGEVSHHIRILCKANPPKQLAVLGYSCAHDDFPFNFSSSVTARKIISDFIASNVKVCNYIQSPLTSQDRRVWYTRDDSADIASSITQLMPPGTETSLAMPVFGFDGQVSRVSVECANDRLRLRWSLAGSTHYSHTRLARYSLSRPLPVVSWRLVRLYLRSS